MKPKLLVNSNLEPVLVPFFPFPFFPPSLYYSLYLCTQPPPKIVCAGHSDNSLPPFAPLVHPPPPQWPHAKSTLNKQEEVRERETSQKPLFIIYLPGLFLLFRFCEWCGRKKKIVYRVFCLFFSKKGEQIFKNKQVVKRERKKSESVEYKKNWGSQLEELVALQMRGWNRNRFLG